MKSIRLTMCLAVAFICFMACKQNDHGTTNTNSVPKVVRDTFMEKLRSRYFFLTNSESFFQEKTDYDYYIVFSVNNWHEDEHTLSIKSQNGIAVITYAKNHFDKDIVAQKDLTPAVDTFFQSAYSIYRKSSDLVPLKNALDSSIKLLHDKEATGYNENSVGFNYFNGKTAYIFSKETIDRQTLDKLDSLFSNSEIYKKLSTK